MMRWRVQELSRDAVSHKRVDSSARSFTGIKRRPGCLSHARDLLRARQVAMGIVKTLRSPASMAPRSAGPPAHRTRFE